MGQTVVEIVSQQAGQPTGNNRQQTQTNNNNTLCHAYIHIYLCVYVGVYVCVSADICVVKGQQNLNNEKSLLNFPQRAQPTLHPSKQSAVCSSIYVESTTRIFVVVDMSFFVSDFLFCIHLSFAGSFYAFTRKSKPKVVFVCV